MNSSAVSVNKFSNPKSQLKSRSVDSRISFPRATVAARNDADDGCFSVDRANQRSSRIALTRV